MGALRSRYGMMRNVTDVLWDDTGRYTEALRGVTKRYGTLQSVPGRHGTLRNVTGALRSRYGML